jgi:hypothetical protein
MKEYAQAEGVSAKLGVAKSWQQIFLVETEFQKWRSMVRKFQIVL